MFLELCCEELSGVPRPQPCPKSIRGDVGVEQTFRLPPVRPAARRWPSSRRDWLRIAQCFNAGNDASNGYEVPKGRLNWRIHQPSLRDSNSRCPPPSVEALGYYRTSLRDSTAAPSAETAEGLW